MLRKYIEDANSILVEGNDEKVNDRMVNQILRLKKVLIRMI